MATITGQVFARNGNGQSPQPGVMVAIIDGTASHPDIAACTDDQGLYELSGLAAGSYVLRADSAQATAVVGDGDERVRCDMEVTARHGSARKGVRSSSGRKPRGRDGGNGGDDYGAVDAPGDDRRPTVVPPTGAPLAGVLSSKGVEPTASDEGGGHDEEAHALDPYDADHEPAGEATVTTEGAAGISAADRGLAFAILSVEIAQGNTSRDSITDAIWRALNPGEGFPIATSDPDYEKKSAQWLRLRREIVDPFLDENPVAPKPKAKPGGPLPLVSARMPSGPTHRLSGSRYKFGLSETIDALLWIAREWHKRHPDVDFMVRDVSRENGGSLKPPHSSHQCGLDADCQLWVGGSKVCMKHRRYPEWRPLIQELVDLARANPVLPVKTIGFTDRQVTGVSHWSGHTCHIHIRFCCPPAKLAAVEAYVAEAYGDQPASKRPRYRCKASQFETGEPPAVPEPVPGPDSGSVAGAPGGLSLVQRGTVFARTGLAAAAGLDDPVRLTDIGWLAIYPNARTPLLHWHEDFEAKRRVWDEIRETVVEPLLSGPRRPA